MRIFLSVATGLEVGLLLGERAIDAVYTLKTKRWFCGRIVVLGDGGAGTAQS